MRASELRDVIYNPIWTSKVLHYFLSGTTISGPPKIKTEMLCLFPLIFNDSMMQLLSRANSASSFYSLFEKPGTNVLGFSFLERSLIYEKETNNCKLNTCNDNWCWNLFLLFNKRRKE